MNIAGWTKSSLINFPGHASAVIFVGGCNFRCGYCHNPEIVFSKEQVIEEEVFFSFLQKRKRFLDGVCISGGEPTLDEGLKRFASRIKSEGYAVKLDTNGSRPRMLREMIQDGLADYVAMDIKGPISSYYQITGVKTDTAAIEESVDILLKGAVGYEFRTTVYKEQIGEEDIRSICRRIQGADRYYIQNYRKTGTDRQVMNREPEEVTHTQTKVKKKQQLSFSPYDEVQLEEFRQIAAGFVKQAGVR